MFPPRRYGGQDLVEAFGPGITIVTIDGVDFEEFKKTRDREAQIVYSLHVRELKLPIKLTKTLAQQIAETLGTEESNEWCGCTIGLRPKQTTIDGEDFWIITCDIQPPQLPPSLGYKLDLVAIAADRANRQLGGKATSPSVGRGQYDPEAQSRPTDIPPNRKVRSHETLGIQRAAMLVELVEQRSKTWAELRTHLRDNVGPAEVFDGIEPWDMPSAFAGDAWRWAKSFPECAQGRTAAQIVRAWQQRQAANQVLADGTVMDPATGEVIEPEPQTAQERQAANPPGDYEPINEEDIPF